MSLQKVKRLFYKPEYLFNPPQLLERLKISRHLKNKKSVIHLPWNPNDFTLNPNETIGKSILSFGLYDLALSEIIYRSLNKDSICFDVGANIGYFSTLMSRYGKKVQSFEPHPALFERLQDNIQNLSNVESHNFALSNTTGTFDLYIPLNFDKNEGTASLIKTDGSKVVQVPTKTLDQVLEEGSIDLLKIDVEGAELNVLQGAEKALESQRIKLILFEDFAGSQSKVIHFLESKGYFVQRLIKGFWGPRLVSIEEGESYPMWEPPNYVATRDPNYSLKGHWQIFKTF